MATALRCAARKVGGRALQRRQAAIVVEEPKLITGRSRSTSSAAASYHTEGLTAHENGTMTSIQEKSEELYQLIAKNKCLRRQNKELLQHLAVVVQPKPNDSIWHFYQTTKKFSDAWFVVSIGTPIGVTLYPYFQRWSTEPDEVANAESKSSPRGDKEEH